MTRRTIQAKCVDLDDFGRGIVRTENETCFVENLLPGEEAIIETVYEYGKLQDCYIKERLTSSEDRVTPACKFYPACGGCQLMHLSYPKQLEYKQRKVKALLHKFAHLDVEVLPTIGLENPTRFRNKVQKPVRVDLKRNKPIAGFYKTGTHQLISIDDCLMESELSNRITNTLLRLFLKYDYYPFDEDSMTGTIRHILIKTSSINNKALVTLVSATTALQGQKDFAKELISLCPEVVGVVLNINSRHTNVILGPRDIEVFGKNRISDKIFDKEFLISSQSFYQTNTFQIETLYGKAIEFAQVKETDTVLDAYCGTGTIGLSIADKVHGLVGVEINNSAVHDAIINAKVNNIRNAHFERDDATDFMMRTKMKFDVIIMDPPRKGSTPEFIAACKKILPRTIIYVSCDPVTLARDLALFDDTYEVTRVQPVDMFPNTMHVETIVLLSLKDSQ
ncbi:MAG: 23S rRNA (uracil(1939)-C(5))-methyltransferase RlmD [Bacilli bacterium]